MLILSLSIYPSNISLITFSLKDNHSTLVIYVLPFDNLEISEGSDQISERDSEMGRSPCCEKVGLKKGPWTPEEDQKLLAYIEEHGHGSWRALPTKAGLQRCGKSCRLRWTNYLRPDIKRGKFSLQEEQTIIQLHALLGNRWSAIATHLPKRTDNEIKNYWNTHLKKRLAKMGLDPVTHKPKNETLGCQTKNAANLSHMAQWESARLEAEARLVRESKLRQSSTSSTCAANTTKSTPAPPPPPPPPPPCLDVFRAWQSVSSSTGVDLESPKSTLSFSTTGHPIPLTTILAQTLGDVDQEVDWKCFGKSTWLNPGTENENGHGFCGMLLDNSSENLEAQGSCCVEEEQDNNNNNNNNNSSNNNYWDSILDLVNSSSPSNSPSVF